MTYRVVFHATADAETIALPAEAFTALIKTLAAVSRDPYDQAVTLATHDPHIRRATFATLGLCSFHIDEGTRTLRVFDREDVDRLTSTMSRHPRPSANGGSPGTDRA